MVSCNLLEKKKNKNEKQEQKEISLGAWLRMIDVKDATIARYKAGNNVFEALIEFIIPI